MESFEFANYVLFPLPNSGMPEEELREVWDTIDSSNLIRSIMAAHEHVQPTIDLPRLVLPVTSSNSTNSARDVSASSAAHHQQIPANYSASLNSRSWDSHSLQHLHFQEEAVWYPTGSQEMRSSQYFNNLTWSSGPLDSGGMVPTSFPLRATRPRDQLAHPYFRGSQIITPSEHTSIGCPTLRAEESIMHPENFRPISLSQREEPVQLPSALTVNETSELTNSTQIQPANAAQATVTRGSDDTGRGTLSEPLALRQLSQTLRSSKDESQKAHEVIALLRNNPQLMAACIRLRAAHNGNKPNPPNMATTPQQQVGANHGNFITQIPTYQTQHQARKENFCSVTQQNMMTGGTVTIVAQSLPEISDTANPIASEPVFSAALQLAAARQLIVQAAASAAAAGATSFGQKLKDQTHSLDHVMNAHCPSILRGQTQMKAVLPLAPSARSLSPAPRIPTCSICLDQLVSTIVFPCRHFFCENCAPKIKTCGFCREVIEARHRVYF